MGKICIWHQNVAKTKSDTGEAVAQLDFSRFLNMSDHKVVTSGAVQGLMHSLMLYDQQKTHSQILNDQSF